MQLFVVEPILKFAFKDCLIVFTGHEFSYRDLILIVNLGFGSIINDYVSNGFL